MSIETEVLRALLKPEDYGRYRERVQPDALSAGGRLVLSALDSVHTGGQPAEIRPSDLRLACVALNPEMSTTDRESFDSSLERIVGASEAPANIVLRTWVEREMAARLADAADRYIESPGKFKDGFFPVLRKMYDTLQSDMQQFATIDETEDLDTNLESVLADLDVGGGLNWRLNCLNKSLGPVIKGQLIVIGARPEGGKTTLLCSEMAHMLPQLPEDGMIAVFNNETHGRVFRLRQMQAVIAWPTKFIEQRTKSAQEAYDKLVSGNRQVLIKDVHGGSLADVDSVLDKYGDRIKLILFDQAGKLNGYEDKNGNNAARLQKLAAHLKMVAAHVAPVVTTWWCSGEAEGEQYIEMDKLNDSKTGVPGEAEIVVTMGHTKKPEDEGTRYINIPKNKSLACPNEEFRHSKWIVKVERHKARFTD